MEAVQQRKEAYAYLQSWRYAEYFFRGRPMHQEDDFSRRHPQMTLTRRAKIFAPFAALAGYGEAVASKEIIYEPKKDISEEQKEKINQTLNWLDDHSMTGKVRALTGETGPTVQLVYFQRNVLPVDLTLPVNGETENKKMDDGRPRGQYKTIEGEVMLVDQIEQRLEIRDGNLIKGISFDDIIQIRLGRTT